MRTIWKFPLKVTGKQTVDMPCGASILSVQFQGDQLTLWAMVNPKNKTVKRTIHIFGTGYAISTYELNIHTEDHIATVQDGMLVWHVFNGGES